MVSAADYARLGRQNYAPNKNIKIKLSRITFCAQTEEYLLLRAIAISHTIFSC